MKSIEELNEIRQSTKMLVNQGQDRTNPRIVVGMATCGIAAGANQVLDTIMDEVRNLNITDVTVAQTGCIGVCRLEPIVEVIMPGEEKITYVEMTPEKARKLVNQHIKEGKVVDEYNILLSQNEEQKRYKSLNDVDFYKKQFRIALKNCGVIDPESIDEYIAVDGYKALEKVLLYMRPEEVVDLIKQSGLRGRGGGGFPTGLKWKFTAKAQGDQKYVICNADEGDPGAFMDRSILEGDPYTVLEAMTLAGYAIGANKGYIYVRAEYPMAVKRLDKAITKAKEYGLLGKNIFETNFDFDLEIRLGAGAFVCGEETALIHSIEGERGVSTQKPPFPANSGLWGKPTLINNVETFANITQIILKGHEWFKSIGTEKSPGTKVFALGGKINNPGLVEIPMGTPLREVIYKIGDGIPNNKKFKAVQTGGPSGGCIPAELLDSPIDYDTLIAIGSMMGSGGMIVMDEDNCMVDVAKFFLEFVADESCGKCTPCRIGTRRLFELLEKITSGNGSTVDIDKLENLSREIKATALCGLGQTAPNPVLSTLRYFKNEYNAHVDKECPAGACQSLISYVIDHSKCMGCGICSKACPADAIFGELKKPYTINQDICVTCGACISKCKFNAIEIH